MTFKMDRQKKQRILYDETAKAKNIDTYTTYTYLAT